MEIYPDFQELLGLFNARGVEYVIVGGYAMAAHGSPRYTGDMDLLVKPAVDNAEKILRVLDEFGFGSLGLSIQDFTTAGQMIQLGVPPVRVDILTDIDGPSWEQVERGKMVGDYGGLAVPFIGRQELLANKKATGRTRDQADLEALGED